MRTNVPMFLDTPMEERPVDRIDLAGKQGWQAAYDAVCDAVQAEFTNGVEDERVLEQAEKSVADAVTNTWHEGITHDDWCSFALMRLRRGA